jgi:CobQ/CobB/MinD/ParA nucleotide binding domain
MPKEINVTNGHRPSVHVVLQAKGGVGKSFVAAILAQYFNGQQAVRCFDTDPGNATLAQYKALAAEHIGDLIQGGVINQKRFDPLIEKLLNSDGTSIVDTGASTFLPFWNYVLENEILPLLESQGRQVFIHCVVTGGQAMADTLNGLDRLAQTTSQKALIVWLNEFFGEVREGKRSFEQFKLVQELAPKLVGSVLIRKRNPHTFEDDVQQMLLARLTFDEAIAAEDFSLVSKQRLQIVRRELFEQLDGLGL